MTALGTNPRSSRVRRPPEKGRPHGLPFFVYGVGKTQRRDSAAPGHRFGFTVQMPWVGPCTSRTEVDIVSCTMLLVPAYSELVIEHFEHPRNAGAVESPDGEATTSNPVCGDRMRVTIRVEDGRLAEVRWQTRGCPPAIATSSFASEMVRGWTLDEVDTLTRQAIADGIGGLPKDKVHCSVLAADAIRAAVADYRQRVSGSP